MTILDLAPTRAGIPATAEATGPAAGTVDIRDSMDGLPRLFALPLTFLSGKPHTGQRPLQLTPTAHLAAAVVCLGTGLAVSGGALTVGGWWLTLLVPGWAMTLHAMRNLRMMMFHQCAHRNMWGHRRLDRALGRLIAGLLVVQSFERYSAEHVSDHHALHHMTLRDPTVQAFLVSLELRAGMTRRQMCRRLLGK